MNTIARNAIYAATAFMLWPITLYANSNVTDPALDCPPIQAPQFTHRRLNASDQRESHRTERVVTRTAAVEFQMYAGRLRPQLERMLRQHMAVQHIVWQVAEEHEWPSTFKLEGDSWSALIESLLSPYQLRLQLFANHSAVITYLPVKDAPGRGQL